MIFFTFSSRSILAPAGITYPLATLVIGISFFFVVFLEEGILAVNFRRSPDEDVEIFNGREMEKRQQRDDESDRFLLDDSDSKGKETSAEYGSMKEPTSGIVTDAAHHLSPGKMAVEDTTSVSNISMSELTLDEVHYHVDPSVYQTSVRASILVTSLVVHSVFEGLAIGLQMKTTEVWALFIAIGVHKAAVSFCLGSHLVESYKEFRSLVAAIIIFSFTTSICVAIGTVITEAVGSGGIVDTAAGVLLAVATGSFLYITFCEILQKELSKARDSTLGGQVIRTFALLAGFGVCAGICVLNH